MRNSKPKNCFNSFLGSYLALSLGVDSKALRKASSKNVPVPVAKSKSVILSFSKLAPKPFFKAKSFLSVESMALTIKLTTLAGV